MSLINIKKKKKNITKIIFYEYIKKNMRQIFKQESPTHFKFTKVNRDNLVYVLLLFNFVKESHIKLKMDRISIYGNSHCLSS